jgi:hypothetical protein
MSKWFAANKLALSVDETNIIKFIMKNSPQHTLNIGYKEKYVESVNTRFLGLQTNKYLNWKNHIDQLVLKLHGVCYAVKSISHISNTDTLKSIFFCLFSLCNEIWNNLSG